MKSEFLFKFNSKTRNLYHNDKHVGRLNTVEGRILEALISSSDNLIDRDKLLDIAWPNKDVTPNSLNVAIKKIRSFFIPSVGQEVITTHFKKGFSWNHQYVTCVISSDLDVSGTPENVTVLTAPEDVLSGSANQVQSRSETAQHHTPDSSSAPREKKFLKSSWLTLGYYLLCAVLILFIIFHALFYVTQVTVMSCQNIKKYEFCGYGTLNAADIPSQLPPGNYIYVNSEGHGFQYAETK